jgi:hypothetical protein
LASLEARRRLNSLKPFALIAFSVIRCRYPPVCTAPRRKICWGGARKERQFATAAAALFVIALRQAKVHLTARIRFDCI